MKNIELTNQQIPLIKQTDIMFLMYAESGAMGEAGSVKIFTKEAQVIKCYDGNYVFGNLDIKKIEKLFPVLASFEHSKELTGWKYEYLGMGNHLFIRDCIYNAFKEDIQDAAEDELYGIYTDVAEKVLKAECDKENGKMYNLVWSRKELTPQKLGTFCEYYAKMSLASYGMSIYTPEVDDHGIDFIIEAENNFLKFQVKAVRRATTGYVFARKETFNITDDTLFLYLILLTDGEQPHSYIIPTSAWRNDHGTKLFVDHDDYEKPEWGINISEKNMHQLEQYSIEKMIDNLK